MPKYLYKILSLESWGKSQTKSHLLLSKDDETFIHFSTEEQLDRIIKKYWSNGIEYVVLTVEVSLLSGRLVYETNPGRDTKYYHLYDGSIPLESTSILKRPLKSYT